MSYDLDALHQKYGVQVASLRFATVSDAAGTTVIPGVAGQAGIIHQVVFGASAWANLSLGYSTAAGTMVYNAFAGQTMLTEGTRVPADSGASVFAFLASVGVVSGSGFYRVYYTYQRSVGVNIAST